MKRTPALQRFIDNLAKEAFDHNPGDPTCVFCGSDKIEDEDFTDELSRKEFSISQMCQKCQDETFVERDED